MNCAKDTCAKAGALLVVCLALFGFCLPVLSQNQVFISNIRDYYHWPQESFAEGMPLRIKAHVTYYDEGWHQLYVQDDTAGMFIDTLGLGMTRSLSEVVLVEGVTFVTNTVRRIRDIRIQPVRESGTFIDRPVNAAGLNDTRNGSCLVRVQGTVRAYAEDGDRLYFDLEMEGRTFPVWVKRHMPSDLRYFLGAKVRVEAVCSQGYDNSGKMTQAKLLVSGFRSIRIEQPGIRDPFALPLTSIIELFSSVSTNRVCIQGVVTSQSQSEWVEMAEGTNIIRILTCPNALDAQGKVYEASGVLQTVGGRKCLANSAVRELGAHQGDSAPAETNSLTVLTRIGQVANLLASEALHQRPVRLTGSVTFHDPAWQNLFISDGTNGIYVELGSEPLALKLGDKVQVVGVTAPGDGIPFITRTKIKILGEGPMVSPIPLEYNSAISGTNDCQWVEIGGVVQTLEERDNHYYFDVITENGAKFNCLLACVIHTNFLTDLPNAKVVIRGVCANEMSENLRMTGFTIRVHDESLIQKLGHSTEIECSIGNINKTTPIGNAAARYKVKGIVSLALATDVYIQDKTGGIHVKPSSFRHSFVPGDEVEVSGIRETIDFMPILNKATIRLLKSKIALAPKTGKAENLVSFDVESELVKVTASLLEDVAATNKPQFYAQDGELVFKVVTEGFFGQTNCPDLKAGSGVRLTGVCAVSRADAANVKVYSLLLRSPSDIEVIWSPPEGINWNRILLGTGVIGGVFLAGLGWVVSLRRQVQLQTRQISARLEREVALEARLRQSQKMESIGQLAAGVAHDFNNILTVIQGHACLLSSQPNIAAEDRESVEQISQSAKRAADLTRQLLAFSRKQPMQLRVLDLNLVLNDISKLVARLVGENISLKICADPNLPMLKGDSGMLQQVIMNLAVNARDAMPEGGRLEISTGVKMLHKHVISDMEAERSGTFICMRVRDTGVGMSKEVMARIFEPFFTTKDVGKGTGLGLSTAYGIVQQHGGWIDVDSQPGKGTDFDLYFPVYLEQSSSET